jgi:Flp pilus assembly protein TadB
VTVTPSQLSSSGSLPLAPVSGKTSVWAIPWTALIIVLILIVLVVLAVRRSRSRRRSRRVGTSA